LLLDFPVEPFGVELLRFLAVLAADLKMHHRASHRSSPFCAAKISIKRCCHFAANASTSA